MAAIRLTRTERKERTRADLIEAARRVFLRNGFHAASLDAIGELIAELGRRHGVEYLVPAREVARGSGAMMRGMAVERLLDEDAVPPELFEELHAAYMRGMARNPTTERNER